MNKDMLLEYTAEEPPKPLSDEQIAEVEHALHLRLPSDFKSFIKKWNNAVFNGQASYYLRLMDFADLSYIRELQSTYSTVVFEYKDQEGFPEVDQDAVDVLIFADNMFEANYALLIDKKNPERCWIVETDEGELMFCVNSVSAFLDELLDDAQWPYVDEEDKRTLKQKLSDWVYGTKPEEPLPVSLHMRGRIADIDIPCGSSGKIRSEKYPPKIEIGEQNFAVVLPMGTVLPMMYVPAEPGGPRSFWISRVPVSCECFLPVSRIEEGRNWDELAVVSAEAAEAFCAILNDFFAASLPDGYAFALPSDAECQRALKHAGKTAEKPTKASVIQSILKLLVRPNPGPERPTDILFRNRASHAPEKLPFYIVLTSDLPKTAE